MTTRTTRIARITIVSAVALALSTMLPGCTPGGSSLSAGTCIMDPGFVVKSDEIQQVSCDDPHDYEVYATKTVEGDTLPADIDEQAEAFCQGEAFQEYIGIAYAESELSSTSFTPTQSSWDAGQRTITCLVSEGSEGASGSLKGAQR